MTAPIVRQIDHVYVALDDAEAGFAFAAEVLGLPVVWPYMDYGLFGSGGVSLGNVNLEILKANEDFPTGRAEHPARIAGIAFEPGVAIDDLVTELDSRDIGHTPPMPFTPPAMDKPMWTNVGVDITDGTFFCNYHFDVPARRAELEQRLRASDGGKLGVQRVAEIVLGSPDVDSFAARWQRLLDPIEPEDGPLWRIGDGPAVRLQHSDARRVEHLVIAVADRKRVGSAERITPDELGGLELHLI